MKKQQKILLVRTSYWVGVILDALVAIQLLLPDFWAQFEGLTTYTPNTTLNFALGIASALMFGWTALLIWADRKPFERKGVLLLTFFPLCGLTLNNIAAVLSGLKSVQSTLPELAIQFALMTLFASSYLTARKET